MIEVLQAMQQRLSADAELNALIVDKYGKPLKHSIGYKKTSNAGDYPILSYVLAKASYQDERNTTAKNEFVVSLVLGLLDNTLVDANGVKIADGQAGAAAFVAFAGNVNTAQAVKLILANFKKTLRLGHFFITSDFLIFPEEPNFPYFNTEISFKVCGVG